MTDEAEGSSVWYPDGTMPLGSIIVKWWVNDDGQTEFGWELDTEHDTLTTVLGFIESVKWILCADTYGSLESLQVEDE